MKNQISKFFALARERQNIYLRRQAGLPREQWTKDPIYQKYRFCNLFREQDKTTVWFREHVRDPMRDDLKVLLATVVFRMLNRVTSGEAMFCQPDLNGHTAFDKFALDGDARHLRRDLIALMGKKGPFVTGSYIISSPPGYTKLDGMMKILQDFHKKSLWQDIAFMMRSQSWKLEQAHEWFSNQPWMGNFHAYEIVTDLRWTRLLERAPDIMSWCNVGPGCKRGLNRVHGRDKKDRSLSTEEMLGEMRQILDLSRDVAYWPQITGDRLRANVYRHNLTPVSKQWPKWEMRDVEHELCEVDKYLRTQSGEGRPRGVYR